MHRLEHRIGNDRDDDRASTVAGRGEPTRETALVREKFNGIGDDRPVGHAAAESDSQPVRHDQHPD